MSQSVHENNQSDQTQPDSSTEEEKGTVPMVDLFISEAGTAKNDDPGEKSLVARLFQFSRVMLYIALGLSTIEPLKNLQKSQNVSEAILPIVLYPFLIFLHMRLVKKVESELANNKDYLLGGILFFFVAGVLFILSLTISVPYAFLRGLGILISIIHLLYGISVLRRYK